LFNNYSYVAKRKSETKVGDYNEDAISGVGKEHGRAIFKKSGSKIRSAASSRLSESYHQSRRSSLAFRNSRNSSQAAQEQEDKAVQMSQREWQAELQKKYPHLNFDEAGIEITATLSAEDHQKLI
jgi:hypothetical protein